MSSLLVEGTAIFFSGPTSIKHFVSWASIINIFMLASIKFDTCIIFLSPDQQQYKSRTQWLHSSPSNQQQGILVLIPRRRQPSSPTPWQEHQREAQSSCKPWDRVQQPLMPRERLSVATQCLGPASVYRNTSTTWSQSPSMSSPSLWPVQSSVMVPLPLVSSLITTPPRPSRRELQASQEAMSARCVARAMPAPPRSRHTCALTAVRSRITARYAARHSPKLLISQHTSGRTVERSHSAAPFARSDSLRVHLWQPTFELTLGRGRIGATIAAKPLPTPPPSPSTSVSTVERNHTAARSAISDSLNLVTYTAIWRPTPITASELAAALHIFLPSTLMCSPRLYPCPSYFSS